MSASPLPFASIENDFLRLDYLTTTGPRIIGLYVNGVEGNLLAETPDVHWPTPHGEYYLRGGHRLWTAPEDPFYTCPEDHVNVISEPGKVVLQSKVDASGLQKEISLYLDENRVLLTHRVTWHGQEGIELAPWAITQLRLGGMVIVPQSTSTGLLPNRNLVFWPYSQIHDERLEIYDDLVTVNGKAAEQPLKIGNYNPCGWIACIFDKALFVKWFPINQFQAYPDMGCNVEIYVKDSCIELETLGCMARLEPGGSVFHNETWKVLIGEYSPTLDDSRMIIKQLSRQKG